ncbi:MAG: DUF5309 family protein [Planctomycetota bacterium]
MAFTGKATFSAGSTLPELAEDVSDVVSIISPHETPLLDHLGDAPRQATSTVHEWLEDTLLPNTDTVDDDSIANGMTDAIIRVANIDRFKVGDQIQIGAGEEVMLVLAVNASEIALQRQYGGTTATDIADGVPITILGNAALEGDAAPVARFTNRIRRQNYTQIFTKSVEVSGSQQAAQTLAIADEMDYQVQERLRELIRDLENCVINGVASTTAPQGDMTVRRTMRGILPAIETNVFTPGDGTVPDGAGTNDDLLTEPMLNAALRAVWAQSSGTIDTIVCGGFQKRRINEFIASNQRFIDRETTYQSLVHVYESDFGVCRVVMSRWLPTDALLLLDSSRIDVLALQNRSFTRHALAKTGDAESAQLIGEYTLEMRNENAHACIRGLGLAA